MQRKHLHFHSLVPSGTKRQKEQALLLLIQLQATLKKWLWVRKNSKQAGKNIHTHRIRKCFLRIFTLKNNKQNHENRRLFQFHITYSCQYRLWNSPRREKKASPLACRKLYVCQLMSWLLLNRSLYLSRNTNLRFLLLLSN